MRDIVPYLMASTCLMGVLASIIFMSIPLLVFCITAAALGGAVYKGWNLLIEPFLFRHSNLVQVVGEYELSGDRAVALRRVEGGFSAVAAAVIDITSAEEVTRDKLEGIIQRVSRPFKLTVMVSPVDTSKMMSDLATKRYMMEGKLSRLHRTKTDEMRIEQQKNKLDEVKRDIEEINSGRIPLRLLCHIMTSSRSESRFAAQEGAIVGIKELANAFDGATGSSSSIVSGGELTELLEMDAVIAG